MGRSAPAGPVAAWIEAELALGAESTIFVDGFNVLHAALLAGERDAAWWGRVARDRLLDLVRDWPDPGAVVWIAFDGREAAWSTLSRRAGPRVHSVFVPSADDWIVRCARRAPAPERTFVVSADGQVAGRARSAGSSVLTPRDFVARCRERTSDSARNSDQASDSGVPAADGAEGEPEAAAPAAPRPSPKTLS